MKNGQPEAGESPGGEAVWAQPGGSTERARFPWRGGEQRGRPGMLPLESNT